VPIPAHWTPHSKHTPISPQSLTADPTLPAPLAQEPHRAIRYRPTPLSRDVPMLRSRLPVFVLTCSRSPGTNPKTRTCLPEYWMAVPTCTESQGIAGYRRPQWACSFDLRRQHQHERGYSACHVMSDKRSRYVTSGHEPSGPQLRAPALGDPYDYGLFETLLFSATIREVCMCVGKQRNGRTVRSVHWTTVSPTSVSVCLKTSLPILRYRQMTSA
jgi:hypothetical protein